MLAIIPAAESQSGNSQIYYTSTQLNSSGTSTSDTFTFFDNLPAEPAAGETTHLFSYQGSLFSTVGTNMFQLMPANTGDPTLYQAAVDDWTKTWTSPWISIAQALPAADALDVVQYYTYASDGTVLTQGVINLGSDFSLSYASGNIVTNTTFTTLNFSPTTSFPTAPQFTKIASYNSALWGFVNTQGQSPTIYKLLVSADFTTYHVDSTSQMQDQSGTDFSQYTVSDITAVDTGLAVALSDGNIWKEIYQPTKDASGNVTTTWQQYLPLANYTNLGAASPGVIVDLKLLLTYLKSNYIETQTDVLQTIPLIQAYTASHENLLTNMAGYINAYNATSDPAQKAAIETEAGSDAITQANYYGGAVSSSLAAINNAVVAMGRQSASVSSTLTAQLYSLGEQLAGLESTLKSDQQTLDNLQAGFWASVAICLAGK